MQVFTSLLVLGIFVSVFIINDIRSYKSRKVDNVLSLAQVIGSNSISTLTFQNDETAKEILLNLHSVTPEIMYAGILDKDGKVFASYSKSGNDDSTARQILGNRNWIFRGDRLYVSANIVDSKIVIGKVILEEQLSDLEEMKKEKYAAATLLLLFAVGVSFLIAMIMQTTITRRLAKLVATMKEVSVTADYGKSIRDDGKDEISILTQGFNQLMQQIKLNQQKKDEFIGIASHELKTPLTTIKGYLELLKQVEDRPLNKQFVEKASRNVEKLENLIRDLLDVTKIQGGQLELNAHEFVMEDLLAESIAAIQPISSQHHIEREGNLGNAMVMADRQRIEQVLVNLLSNAIKYSPGEKKVIVQSRIDSNEMTIKIRDFGIGIPKEEQSYIFERFYRTRDSSIHISGFGLGLYICKDIINRHGGKIWVETEDKGSTFCFTLPLDNHNLNAYKLS
jgi:signal transduction histidine kinase